MLNGPWVNQDDFANFSNDSLMFHNFRPVRYKFRKKKTRVEIEYLNLFIFCYVI